ncbi:MAG: hypothetical protein ACI4R8_03595 [Candidatus Caccovivens sp.]
MKEEKKNTYKILLDNSITSDHCLTLIKLPSYEEIRRYNSEKFSKILADKIVFISATTSRVDAKFNPHIAKELIENNCNNWRVDRWQYLAQKTLCYDVDKRAEYKVDFDTGTVTRTLSKNERKCKHCGKIVDKNDIIGAFCENCLTREGGLAYRYGYHNFRGNYTIHEKKINQKKVAVFGAEIERDYLAGEYDGNFNENLHRALIESTKLLYGDKLKQAKPRRKAVFMTDGSLTNYGIEWITFPQSYQAYKNEEETLSTVLEVMKKYNFANSKNAGNHIHINRKFFGDKDNNNEKSKYAAAKMALLLNEYWNEFVTIAKRKDTYFATKPTQTKKDKIFTLVEKTVKNEHNHSAAVNLQHKDTIEIRIWSGIDSTSDLFLYLDLTQALATFAKKKSLEKCQRAKLIDIFEFLTDKKEHLLEIKKRLNEKEITKYNEEIENLLKDEVK